MIAYLVYLKVSSFEKSKLSVYNYRHSFALDFNKSEDYSILMNS